MARKKVFWPKILPRTNAAGIVTSYTVDCGYQQMNGHGRKRIRHSFKTLAEAEAKAEELRITRRNEGTLALAFASRDRVDADRALELLRPHKITLLQAAEFYLKNIRVIQTARKVPEVVKELLELKRAKGKRPRYLQDLRNRLERFASDENFRERLIYDIEPVELDAWLGSLSVSPTTVNNYRRVLSVLFRFAWKRKYTLKSPVADVELAEVEPSKPAILSLAESRALLEAALAVGERPMMASIAICLFAGLRPNSELWRLEWSHIHLEEEEEAHIEVNSSKNSTSHRNVKIEPNLWRWLKTLPGKKTGPVSLRGTAYYWRLQELRKTAIKKLEAQRIPMPELSRWSGDVMRHTFASMHYAAFRSAETAAKELGHGSSLTMFKQRYYGRVRESDALAYWQILPPAR